MSADVWWVTLISIPVSIAVALAVPHIQRWINQRGQTSHAKKLNRMKDEYDEALFYALHTDMLIGKLIVSELSLTVLLFFLIASLLIGHELGEATGTIWQPVVSTARRTQTLVALLSALIACMTALMVSVSRYVSKSVRLFFNVRYFKTYAESIPAELRNLNMEKIVIAAAWDRAVPGLDFLRSERPKSHKPADDRDGSGSDAAAPAPASPVSPPSGPPP